MWFFRNYVKSLAFSLPLFTMLKIKKRPFKLPHFVSYFTAIPLPIKLYVALRVGVAVILSQRPTPGTTEYSTNRFCGEPYVLACVLKSQVFKLCFGAKSFVPGEKLAKLRKEEDR